MKFSKLSFAAFMPIVIALQAEAQTTLEKITIAYPSRSIASIDLYIALDRGFFRQEGLAADVVQVRGNIAVTALLSGEIHAVMTSARANTTLVRRIP